MTQVLAKRGIVSPIVKAPAPAGEVPSEFRIFRRGENPSADGTIFIYNEVSAERVIDVWRERKLQLMVDYEHSSEEPAADGEIATHGAPAAGWFDLEDRPDGLYAVNCNWKEPAATYLKEGKYKYFSPVFYHSKEFVVGELKSIALTNVPKLNDLTPLAAKDTRGNVACKAGPVAYKKYPLSATLAWDPLAQIQSWKLICSSDGTGSWPTVNLEKFALMFAEVAGDGSLPADYRYPHHVVVNGGLETNQAGVTAACIEVQKLIAERALGAVGGDGMDRGGLNAVKTHLEKHCREFSIEAPWEASVMKAVLHLTTAKNTKLSFEQIRDLVCEALRTKFDYDAWALDIYDDHIIYQRDGKTWSVTFVLTDNVCTIADDSAVVIRTYEKAKNEPSETKMEDSEMMKALKEHGASLVGHGTAMKESTECMKEASATMKEVAKILKDEAEEKKKAKEQDEEEKKAKALKDAEEKKAKAKAEDPDDLEDDKDEPALKAEKAECKRLLDEAVQGVTPALTPGEARTFKFKVKAKQTNLNEIKTYIADQAKLKDAARRAIHQETTVAISASDFKFSEKAVAKAKGVNNRGMKVSTSPGVTLEADPAKMGEFTLAVCKELRRNGKRKTEAGKELDYEAIYADEAVLKNWEAARVADANYKENMLTVNLPPELKFHSLSGDTGPY